MKLHERRYVIRLADRRGIWRDGTTRVWSGTHLLTNSNGEHFAPTIAADEYKMSQHQKDRNGGYVLVRFAP